MILRELATISSSLAYFIIWARAMIGRDCLWFNNLSMVLSDRSMEVKHRIKTLRYCGTLTASRLELRPTIFLWICCKFVLWKIIISQIVSISPDYRAFKTFSSFSRTGSIICRRRNSFLCTYEFCSKVYPLGLKLPPPLLPWLSIIFSCRASVLKAWLKYWMAWELWSYSRI